MNAQVEFWKPVVGYEGLYEVSNLSRVRSLGRWVRRYWGKVWLRERVLKQPKRRGYPVVGLTKQDGSQTVALVSRLVLEAFKGPCLDGMEACHNDGNPANNRLDNLRWDTHKANMADKLKHGTANRGERNHRAKLTKQQVREIRRLREDGVPKQVIASRFKIHPNHVDRLNRRENWGWLKEAV